MSKADQFQQYAEEAMRWAGRAKTENEKQAYIDLARTWAQAAVQSEHIFGVADGPARNQSPVRAPLVGVPPSLQGACEVHGRIMAGPWTGR
jgi:hypothetical protein